MTLPHSCIRSGRRDFRSLGKFAIAKVWRSPFAKADLDQPEYEWLHQIADDAAPEVARRFMDAIRRLRGTAKEAELQAALASGDIDKVMAVLGVDADIQQIIAASLTPPLQSTVMEAGAAAIDATPAISTQAGALSMRFDLVNPHTVQAVRTYGFDLIQQISEDTRVGIRQIVADAMEFGGHPYDQARQIRSLIGLTEDQANAVSNFRTMLENRDRAALTREIRDRRFDGTLERALGDNPTVDLSQEQIDRMVERYAARMLDYRAKNIARTETINAARIGTQESWHQAVENGLLDATKVRQGWLVTPDDRLCIYCAAVPLMNPKGVPLGEQFHTPLGPSDGPGLHPSCRCAVYLLAF